MKRRKRRVLVNVWSIITNISYHGDPLALCVNGAMMPGAFLFFNEETNEQNINSGHRYIAESQNTKYIFYQNAFVPNGNVRTEQKGVDWIKKYQVK